MKWDWKVSSRTCVQLKLDRLMGCDCGLVEGGNQSSRRCSSALLPYPIS